MNPHSRVVPPDPVLALFGIAGGSRHLQLVYRGDVGVGLQHLCVLIGRSAHLELWPRIFDWLEEIEADPTDGG